MDKVIEINKLNFAYDHNLILKNINLVVHHRDYLGIIGPNGGGKSTLLKIILGLLKPSSGKIKVLGKNPRSNSNYIGYMPQKLQFDLAFPIKIWDMVLLARLGKKRYSGFYNSNDKKIVEKSLKDVGIWHLKDKVIGELSGGQLQRATIARALSIEPEILLLDEPLSQVDTAAGKDFYALLKELNNHKTIILVTHDLSIIPSNVKQIACLNQELYYHDEAEINDEIIQKAGFACPIDLIGHGDFPHRVLKRHGGDDY